MDSFDEAKKDVLLAIGGPDKSRQGAVDEAAWPFIDTINDLGDYYTTSSCAGRINVFKEPTSGKKHEAAWLYVTHDLADKKEVLKALETVPKETLWLRMESPIYHVACRTQEAAENLLKVCQATGWKRSGIISTGGKSPRQKRVMVEILGNERIDTPLSADGEMFFDEKFTTFLVMKANEKLLDARRRMEELRLAIVAVLG